MTKTVKFWFDVTCPFAWQTSRWMKEVEKVRDVEIQWIPMSLSVLNEGRDLPEDYLKLMELAWAPARICAAVAEHEPEKLDALYTAFGTHIHEEGNREFDSLIPQVLEEVELPAEFAQYAEGGAIDQSLRNYHQGAMDAVGDEVGTPVLQLGETAFFGPVITRVPRGEEAGEIFDAAVRLAQYPYFFEIKRTRTERPQVGGDAT
ncbi:disulfide bond formation protein DsbA [Corynebacterium poyangense]|uniref:Disulfide bond formation protein DsbA n=1 Tax=Corynebacterium poyangense TaxID=2684405 RepID=A0A7H0SQL8_9CORY|nr:DsbA family protein [Corynebacterium poyangense]MBZ8178264.1 disulfide bond formation protein DsbA [Corynebacterium poyangense]QNQ90843.1 disulfide bond formation protein DsbA [Corynebacterium poyangense]